MTPLDFTNARWADGAAFLSWVDSLESQFTPTTRAWERKLQRWRAGAQASFYDIDEIVVALGLHVSLVPRGIWQPYDNGRRRLAPRRHAAQSIVMA